MRIGVHPILIFVFLAAYALIFARAWQTGLAPPLPGFLAWAAMNASSWVLGLFDLGSSSAVGALFTLRLFLDSLARAAAFFELAGILAEGRPGLVTGMRRVLAVTLAAATLGGLGFSWPALAEAGSARSEFYVAGVIVQRFTGFGLLAFMTGLLAFLKWLHLPIPRLWTLHAWVMAGLLLSWLLPEIALAASVLTSRGREITMLSAPIEFISLAAWIIGMRRPAASPPLSPPPSSHEGELTRRIRALGDRVTPSDDKD